MTFRVKPVGRPGRSDREYGDRRTFLVNVGFTVAIALSLLILVGYAGWSWWDDHNGRAATVNGVTLTKDDLRERYQVELFRLDYTRARIEYLKTLGRVSESDAAQQLAFLDQRLQQLPTITLGRIVDIELQSQLASQSNITVSQAEVDAEFLKEKTIPEERHVWVIEVAPATDPKTGEPGDAEKAAAKATANGALAQLRAGKSWDEVAKAISTASSAPQAGDLGWAEQESSLDPAFADATFSVDVNTPTAVVEGADGIFRIGRATEIAPSSVDTTYEDQLDSRNIKLADYMAAVRADVIRQKLDDMVVADLSKPGPQRHVLQIYIPAPSTPLPDGVKVRHILFSPKDDPAGAADLAPDDPAWKTAEDEARAAYDTLKKDISKFDEMARTLSDESSARDSGGKLPFYDGTSTIDPAFSLAILANGLKPGDLLEPVKSAFGWHVIQFMRPYGDGDEAWLKSVRDQILGGADFGAAARDQGEGAEAAKGGDIGWVAKGVLDKAKETPIFAAGIGGITDIVAVASDGVYLWKVLAEEVRPPSDADIAVFKSSGFQDWYSDQYTKAKVDVDATSAAVLTN